MHLNRIYKSSSKFNIIINIKKFMILSSNIVSKIIVIINKIIIYKNLNYKTFKNQIFKILIKIGKLIIYLHKKYKIKFLNNFIRNITVIQILIKIYHHLTIN